MKPLRLVLADLLVGIWSPAMYRDADRISVPVEKRAATIPAVNGNICLNEIEPFRPYALPVSTDHTARHRPTEFFEPGRAYRVDFFRHPHRGFTDRNYRVAAAFNF